MFFLLVCSLGQNFNLLSNTDYARRKAILEQTFNLLGAIDYTWCEVKKLSVESFVEGMY